MVNYAICGRAIFCFRFIHFTNVLVHIAMWPLLVNVLQCLNIYPNEFSVCNECLPHNCVFFFLSFFVLTEFSFILADFVRMVVAVWNFRKTSKSFQSIIYYFLKFKFVWTIFVSIIIFFQLYLLKLFENAVRNFEDIN